MKKLNFINFFDFINFAFKYFALKYYYRYDLVLVLTALILDKIQKQVFLKIFKISQKSGLGNIRRDWPGDFVMEGIKFAYARPTYRIFGMLKVAGNIYHCTKHQVRGLCVGGDMVILFFLSPAVFTQTVIYVSWIKKIL